MRYCIFNDEQQFLSEIWAEDLNHAVYIATHDLAYLHPKFIQKDGIVSKIEI